MLGTHPYSLLSSVTAMVCVVLGVPASVQAFEVNSANTVPGVVANSLIANGNGADWLTGVILMELTAGSVYNDPDFDLLTPQQHLWGTFPDLEFDSWVGIPGDFSTSILGGAGDLGDLGPAVIADQKVSITWFNTNRTDTTRVRIANISLTDDARGTFSIIAGFSGPSGPTRLDASGWVVNGVAYFNLPGDLNGDGFVGVDDLNLVLNGWNQSIPPANAAADPSGDGFVGVDDLNIVLLNWNIGTPLPPAAVPEPATAAVMLLAGLTRLHRRAR